MASSNGTFSFGASPPPALPAEGDSGLEDSPPRAAAEVTLEEIREGAEALEAMRAAAVRAELAEAFQDAPPLPPPDRFSGSVATATDSTIGPGGEGGVHGRADVSRPVRGVAESEGPVPGGEGGVSGGADVSRSVRGTSGTEGNIDGRSVDRPARRPRTPRSRPSPVSSPAPTGANRAHTSRLSTPKLPPTPQLSERRCGGTEVYSMTGDRSLTPGRSCAGSDLSPGGFQGNQNLGNSGDGQSSDRQVPERLRSPRSTGRVSSRRGSRPQSGPPNTERAPSRKRAAEGELQASQPPGVVDPGSGNADSPLLSIADTMRETSAELGNAMKRIRDLGPSMDVSIMPSSSYADGLRAQHAVLQEFVSSVHVASSTLESHVASLRDELQREKSLRAAEREGLQRMAGLSQAQVKHISDLKLDADRRRIQVEEEIRKVVAHAESEYAHVSNFAAETASQLEEMRRLVIQREQMVIDGDKQLQEMRDLVIRREQMVIDRDEEMKVMTQQRDSSAAELQHLRVKCDDASRLAAAAALERDHLLGEVAKFKAYSDREVAKARAEVQALKSLGGGAAGADVQRLEMAVADAARSRLEKDAARADLAESARLLDEARRNCKLAERKLADLEEVSRAEKASLEDTIGDREQSIRDLRAQISALDVDQGRGITGPGSGLGPPITSVGSQTYVDSMSAAASSTGAAKATPSAVITTIAQFANEWQGNLCSLVEMFWHCEIFFGVSREELLAKPEPDLRNMFLEVCKDAELALCDSSTNADERETRGIIAKSRSPWDDESAMVKYLAQNCELEDDASRDDALDRLRIARRALANSRAENNALTVHNRQLKSQVLAARQDVDQYRKELEEWANWYDEDEEEEEEDEDEEEDENGEEPSQPPPAGPASAPPPQNSAAGSAGTVPAAPGLSLPASRSADGTTAVLILQLHGPLRVGVPVLMAATGTP